MEYVFLHSLKMHMYFSNYIQILQMAELSHSVVSPTSFRVEYKRNGNGSVMFQRHVKFQVCIPNYCHLRKQYYAFYEIGWHQSYMQARRYSGYAIRFNIYTLIRWVILFNFYRIAYK